MKGRRKHLHRLAPPPAERAALMSRVHRRQVVRTEAMILGDILLVSAACFANLERHSTLVWDETARKALTAGMRIVISPFLPVEEFVPRRQRRWRRWVALRGMLVHYIFRDRDSGEQVGFSRRRFPPLKSGCQSSDHKNQWAGKRAAP